MIHHTLKNNKQEGGHRGIVLKRGPTLLYEFRKNTFLPNTLKLRDIRRSCVEAKV